MLQGGAGGCRPPAKAWGVRFSHQALDKFPCPGRPGIPASPFTNLYDISPKVTKSLALSDGYAMVYLQTKGDEYGPE